MKANEIQALLRAGADSAIADHSARFFKTGRGEYAEGDIFLGIRVPVLRAHVKHFSDATLNEVLKVLHSKYHEERLFALIVLVFQYGKADVGKKHKIFNAYLRNTKFINNWDLVDSSAHKIVGSHLFDKNREVLIELAKSDNLWERRIAIIATFYFIKRGQFADTLNIATFLLDDSEDLIHKAVGWMLREVGKMDRTVEEAYLKKHYSIMPRTMLRYAIERFSQTDRRAYLTGSSTQWARY